MKSVLATITKEWLLLRRDLAGLMLLLIMPAVLIVVMALIQDAPFRDYQDLRFDLLMADNDKGRLSKEIIKGLKESKNFNLIESENGTPLLDERLHQLLLQGKYRVGIVIPKGASAEVINAANTLANTVADKMGAGRLPAREARDSVQIRLYFDPVTRPTFRTAISFALDRYITASCSNMLVQRLSLLSGAEGIDADTAADGAKGFQQAFAGIGIKEEVLGDDGRKNANSINSVQHNVPAWAIFGMFFIVVPIAGHAIREREEGSALRLQLIPNALYGVALGKILFNALVCLVQFALMCCIGIWLLPLLDLPALRLGEHPLSLIPMVAAIALAATSYGYFIGAVFKTTNQAMPFGAISIVILSAMGGVWVPVDLLSSILQRMALLSPLHWALDGVQHIMLRNAGVAALWKHILFLLLFSAIMSLLGLWQTRRRGHSVQ